MNERQILIAIHRAIDAAASESAEARAVAARYIPGYQAPGVVGWTGSLDVVLGPPPMEPLLPAMELQRDVEVERAEKVERAVEMPKRRKGRKGAVRAAAPAPEMAEPIEIQGLPQVPTTTPDQLARRELERARPPEAVAKLADDDPVRPALEALAGLEVSGRMLSRLLVPLAVLGRVRELLAVTEDGHVEVDPDFARALTPFSAGANETTNAGLAAHLLDDDLFPHIGHWERFASHAETQGTLRSGVASQPAPCTDSVVVEKVNGVDVGAVRLATIMCTSAITDDQVMTFLGVQSWKLCNTLYCNLIDRGAHTPNPAVDGADVWTIHEWTEVLSPDCADSAAGIIQVCLVFKTEKLLPDGTKWQLSYDICPNPSHGNGKVVVDKGTILVQKQGSTWCFNTTKVLRFAGVADGTHLGLVACVLGYGTMAHDFIATCVPAGTASGGTAPEPHPAVAAAMEQDGARPRRRRRNDRRTVG